MKVSMIEGMNEIPRKVVDISNSTWNSMLGQYFVGQTRELHFGNQFSAWGGISNPIDSGVNLYVDGFTISDLSTEYFIAEILFGAKLPDKAVLAITVAPSNQVITPPPKPKALLVYANNLSEDLVNGVNVFNRIVTPNSTLVSDAYEGSIIIGPGSSFSILLKSQGLERLKGILVFTWWEEKI